jgi:hypothetical protein
MRERGRVLGKAEIAADWYDRIYSPTIRAIERNRLGKEHGEAPDADLFLFLHRRRRDAFPSCGCPPLADTFATVAADIAGQRRRTPLFRRR